MACTSILRSRAAVHQLHRHRAVPQRGRRALVDDLEPGDPATVAQHRLLDGVRPCRARARLGRAQRYARSAEAEDVADERSGQLPGWCRDLTRWRPLVDTGARPAGGRGDAPAARSAQPRHGPYALRHDVRARRLQDNRWRYDLDAEERGPAGAAIRLAPDPGARRRLYLVVARRSENGRAGDAGDGAVYASDDGAEHWTRLPLPTGTTARTGSRSTPGTNGGCISPRGVSRVRTATPEEASSSPPTPACTGARSSTPRNMSTM
jgi:hypothetical protein